MKAFVLRIAPSGVDRVSQALDSNQLIIGWSSARGLLDPGLDWVAFRKIIHDTYHSVEPGYTGSGRAAGNIWRFIREMELGDLVVVPHWADCYVAKVESPPFHDESKIAEDTAYRRHAQWLNSKGAIPRRFARAALQSRLKVRQTCVDATDLISEVEDLLAVAESGRAPSFAADLRRRLQEQALKELCSGRLDSFGFERLVAEVLSSLGGTNIRIVPRNQDKGADIVAMFSLAGTFKFALAVQAKHYQPEPPVETWVIDQLADGMEAEGASLGWVVTSGTFSDATVKRKTELEDARDIQIELVDGQQFATLVVEAGLRSRVRLDD